MDEMILAAVQTVASSEFWLWAFAIIGAASHIAAWTPTALDNRAVAAVARVLDAVAGNYGAAANARDRVNAVTRMLK